jgi:hypothetical protein
MQVLELEVGRPGLEDETVHVGEGGLLLSVAFKPATDGFSPFSIFSFRTAISSNVKSTIVT